MIVRVGRVVQNHFEKSADTPNGTLKECVMTLGHQVEKGGGFFGKP
jgi:hypothetical protein